MGCWGAGKLVRSSTCGSQAEALYLASGERRRHYAVALTALRAVRAQGPRLQRRCYWLLESEDDIVLVHYLNVDKAKGRADEPPGIEPALARRMGATITSGISQARASDVSAACGVTPQRSPSALRWRARLRCVRLPKASAFFLAGCGRRRPCCTDSEKK